MSTYNNKNPIKIGTNWTDPTPRLTPASTSIVSQEPHSNIPQNPTMQPGINVSNLLNLLAITDNKKITNKIVKGIGMNFAALKFKASNYAVVS